MLHELSSTGIECDPCGITFTTQQDKEGHLKLEHNEELTALPHKYLKTRVIIY
jgi:hypothetical protein